MLQGIKSAWLCESKRRNLWFILVHLFMYIGAFFVVILVLFGEFCCIKCRAVLQVVWHEAMCPVPGRHLVHRDGDARAWPRVPRALFHVCRVQLDLHQGRPIRPQGRHCIVSDSLRTRGVRWAASVTLSSHLPRWRHVPPYISIPRIPPSSSPRVDSAAYHAGLPRQYGR